MRYAFFGLMILMGMILVAVVTWGLLPPLPAPLGY